MPPRNNNWKSFKTNSVVSRGNEFLRFKELWKDEDLSLKAEHTLAHATAHGGANEDDHFPPSDRFHMWLP